MRVATFIAALLLVLSARAEEPKVYKQVNEDGSITYTDEPPSEDAQPIDLPEVMVVDAPPARSRPATTPGEDAVAGPDYSGFAITRPTQDQTIWNTGGRLDVGLQTGHPLAEGHQVRIYYDGTLVATQRSMTLSLDEVYRGTHTVRAEIIDANGRVRASAGPVTFYMRQHSIQHRNSNNR